jgi:hypothetical protein
VVYAFDRRLFRRAKNVRESWHCIRCGVALNPMESSFVAVAGGPAAATKARACPRCARRDARVRYLGWVVIGATFALALTALWLR